MHPHTFAQTTQPSSTPNAIDLTAKAYDAVNNGSFAVLIVSAAFLVYVKRAIGSWLKSPTAQTFLEILEQIKQNQQRIQRLSTDVDRLDKTTSDLLDQLGEIQEEIKSSGEISRNEYRQIMQEISNIRTLLDRRGNLS